MLPRGLLKEHSQLLAMILRGLDISAIILAGLLAYFARFGNLSLPERYMVALLIAAVLVSTIFPFFHVYQSMRAQSFLKHIRILIQAVLTILMFLAGCAFLTKTGETFSRYWFILWMVFAVLLFILFRCSLLVTLRIMRSHGLNERNIVIIGSGELAQKLIGTVQQALWTGFRVVAVLDKVPDNISDWLSSKKQDIDEIWIAMPSHEEKKVKKILYDLRHNTVTTRLMLDVMGLDLLNHSITDLAGFPMLTLNASPMVGINRVVKAIEDRAFAFLILVLISPLFLLIALGVKCSSKGPIFFKQLRHGWDGRVIKVYKFRTMIEHEEMDGEVKQATQTDQRVTKFGKFLRSTSLDELPQFINVLQGKMSIVGPRPHAVSHNEFYKDSIKAYMQRHKVKPGITGWAQVNGWRGETDTLDKMEKRIQYDLYYIDNWSLFFDLKIILMTFFQGFIHKNAY
jgi:putative colanic acid biosynthesis UDP-glucose lipid carrier transferase